MKNIVWLHSLGRIVVNRYAFYTTAPKGFIFHILQDMEYMSVSEMICV